MTTMIYRGCTNIAPALPVTPGLKHLVYRSVRHDGITMPSPRRSHGATMSYRGVAYTIAPQRRAILEDRSVASPVLGSALA